MTNDRNGDAPLLVGFVADLMFTTRIAKVAEHLGFDILWLESAGALGEDETRPEGPGEALHGRAGRLSELVALEGPALLIFDLTNQAIPWRQWIPMLKSSPATRRTPVLCFGPHEDVATMTAARDAGADAVFARSRFTASMPDILARYARVADSAALVDTCAAPLPDLVREGIELFNAGQYYKCHDSLEEAWMADESPGRDLYRGILQVGIAYFQIGRGNYRGAAKMLLRVRQWLDPLPAVCRGVDVAALRDSAARVYDALTALGPEQIEEFDQSLFQPVRLVE